MIRTRMRHAVPAGLAPRGATARIFRQFRSPGQPELTENRLSPPPDGGIPGGWPGSRRQTAE
jgi:hypothetical protein